MQDIVCRGRLCPRPPPATATMGAEPGGPAVGNSVVGKRNGYATTDLRMARRCRFQTQNHDQQGNKTTVLGIKISFLEDSMYCGR